MTEQHGRTAPRSGDGRTVVHLVRHGEVHNPTGVLYGRLPEFHLSAVGIAMAERVGGFFADRDVVHLRCSPLERAQETMAPIAAGHPDLAVVTDGRVIEAANVFQGKVFSANSSTLVNPATWWYLRNPLRPSWGEKYTEIVARMRMAIADAAAAADGHEAVIVSHQLPIWMARCDVEGRRLVHDPRRRECRLASVTSLTIREGRVVDSTYTEPAGDLVPVKARSRKFVAGA